MKSYRDLEIYKLSKKLAIQVHKMSLTLPKIELFEEGSQIRRSSKGICTAIVEGYARGRNKADFIKYLTYAHAECDETILHLEFLFECGSLKDRELYEELLSSYNSLGRKINKLFNGLSWNGIQTRNQNLITVTRNS